MNQVTNHTAWHSGDHALEKLLHWALRLMRRLAWDLIKVVLVLCTIILLLLHSYCRQSIVFGRGLSETCSVVIMQAQPHRFSSFLVDLGFGQ